ncbi:maleylpyruvate isomerase N-terminal domain-containing protein [Nocardioides panacisoli]|uniref:Maleylpyruvate isomerase N-terminal domain-containing protein n=1 Tax=Nocardioides panacisoli TaxID=627624 RepID=A0ABP7ITB2_9ACTN
MTYTWDTSREAFAAAARWFVGTAALVGDRWSAPGLGEWDVRALVGHTSRSFLTVETYLERPAETAAIPSPAGYYRATSALSAGPEVADRGRAAGAALGDDPAAAVAQIAERVLPLVDAHDGTELLTTIAGGMRLSDYLPTRTFELTVHTADLARALSLPVEPPVAAARQVMQLLTDLSIDTGAVGQVLLALTGRSGLPSGFSVL